jgi:FKBP-type peptidyl-prolyl cis-trans isomerase
MNNTYKTIALFFVCFLLLSCTKQQPQLPSNKGVDIDRKAVSLLTINQNLAKKEDGILKAIALQKDKAFKKSEIGFWYKIERIGKGPKINDSTVCKFSCRLLSLKGKLLQRDDKQIVIGKKQIVAGLEEGLKLMNKGDSATIIVPWYLAYGMKGEEPLIPPYTSLIYIVKIVN